MSATPKRVVEEMLEWGEVGKGHSVLEPSAGTGALAFAAKARGARVFFIEDNFDAAAGLESQGLDGVASDFLRLRRRKVVDEEARWGLGEFDRILMNPPFARDQDLAHVRHAFNFLATPGILIAATQGLWNTHGGIKLYQEFRQWVESNGGEWRYSCDKRFVLVKLQKKEVF